MVMKIDNAIICTLKFCQLQYNLQWLLKNQDTSVCSLNNDSEPQIAPEIAIKYTPNHFLFHTLKDLKTKN